MRRINKEKKKVPEHLNEEPSCKQVSRSSSEIARGYHTHEAVNGDGL